MGIEEAMTIFEFFLSIFIPGLLIALFIGIFVSQLKMEII